MYGSFVCQGITGILTQPVKGFSKGGARGALKGVGKGLVGVVVKPVAGLVDMVAYTSEGIRNTPEFMSKRGVIVRVRLPRIWAPGSAVRPFDRRWAVGIELFSRLCAQEGWPSLVCPPALSSRTSEGEFVRDHAAWKDAFLGPVVVFITNRRLVVCVQLPPLQGHVLPPLKVKLAVRLDQISQLQIHGSSVRILSRLAKNNPRTFTWQGCFGGRRDTPGGGAGGGFLTRRTLKSESLLELCVPETRLRGWLVQHIRVATSTDSSLLEGEDWLVIPSTTRNESRVVLSDDDETRADGGGGSTTAALSRMTVTIQDAQIRQGYMLYALEICLLPSHEPAITGGAAIPQAHAAVPEVDPEYAVATAAGGGQNHGIEQVEDAKLWTVYKRYSDFDKLRNLMIQASREFARDARAERRGEGGGRGEGVNVPVLPKKRWRSLLPSVVQERMTGLQSFVSQVTQQRNHPKNAEMLAKFLMAKN